MTPRRHDQRLTRTITSTARASSRAAAGVAALPTRFHNGFAHRFARPDVRFVNINVAGFDAAKHAGESVVADAREPWLS